MVHSLEALAKTGSEKQKKKGGKTRERGVSVNRILELGRCQRTLLFSPLSGTEKRRIDAHPFRLSSMYLSRVLA